MSEVRLCRWHVVTDGGTYIVSEKEKDGILRADMQNARFVQLDDAVVNIAYIKEIYRKFETKDTKFTPISDRDKKYIVAPNKPLLTESKQ